MKDKFSSHKVTRRVKGIPVPSYTHPILRAKNIRSEKKKEAKKNRFQKEYKGAIEAYIHSGALYARIRTEAMSTARPEQ